MVATMAGLFAKYYIQTFNELYIAFDHSVGLTCHRSICIIIIREDTYNGYNYVIIKKKMSDKGSPNLKVYIVLI